ncbi:hypothetical protein MOKP4_15970 [Mycobacterium avium subsp. hominissuis]|uniref:Uncharacterized protein n=1 Tax=Mycobacterium avium subsp. hominissuis TaxID=439334 RepID=A0AAI8SM67_MYCAV|nr:hypothetical protein JPH1_34280 [Mycobacterium avium subsp. hominissuis]
MPPTITRVSCWIGSSGFSEAIQRPACNRSIKSMDVVYFPHDVAPDDIPFPTTFTGAGPDK